MGLNDCFVCNVGLIPLEVPFDAYRACPACGRLRRAFVWARTEKRRYRVRLYRDSHGKARVPLVECWRQVAPTPALDALMPWRDLKWMPKALRTFIMAADEDVNWREYVEQARCFLVDLKETGREGSMTLEAAVEAPAERHREIPQQQYPPRPGFVSNLRGLCRVFEAEGPRDLNRRVYEVTRCGAGLTLYLWDDRKVSPGDALWETLGQDTLVRGFELHSIVEGSDAEPATGEMMLPVMEEEVTAALARIEFEADYVWRRLHNRWFMLVDGDGDCVATYEQTQDPERPGWWPADVPESDDEIGGTVVPTLDPAILDECRRLIEEGRVMEGLGPEGSHPFELKGQHYELRHAPE